MLSDLTLHDVGPLDSVHVEFNERLNIFAGDNGLGKTFLLDFAWWALTGTWAGLPALPHLGDKATPEAGFHFVHAPDSASANSPPQVGQSKIYAFNYKSQTWAPRSLGSHSGWPAVYARADGGFSVYDPYRASGDAREYDEVGRNRTYHFTAATLWDGLEEAGRVLCNGLIRDWVNWQNQPNQGIASPFQILMRVVGKLSHPDEPIRPGQSTIRVSLGDVRDIPTIDMGYGIVPVTHASAGVKRILGLAYLLVWTWSEHGQLSKLVKMKPRSQMDVLVDEAELHLHPRWQRSIVPALLDVGSSLDAAVTTQLIVTTHSPMVLASVEPGFDTARDKLFLFEIHGGKVTLDEKPWSKQGDATNWLTSEIFGLDQARSREAEAAIEAAEAFMRGDPTMLPAGLKTKDEIHRELIRVLASHDPFWSRWIVKGYEGLP